MSLTTPTALGTVRDNWDWSPTGPRATGVVSALGGTRPTPSRAPRRRSAQLRMSGTKLTKNMAAWKSTKNPAEWIQWTCDSWAGDRFRANYTYNGKEIRLKSYIYSGGTAVIGANIDGRDVLNWNVPHGSLEPAAISKWLYREGCMNLIPSELGSIEEWVAQVVSSSQDFALRGFHHTYKSVSCYLSMCGDTNLVGPNNAWTSLTRSSVTKDWVLSFVEKACVNGNPKPQ